MENIISIREANIDDLPKVAELFNAYRIFYGQADDLKRAEVFINERMEFEESVIFLAELNNGSETKSAGFTQLYPFFTSVGMARKWILNDLFVHPDHRRVGIARMLMDTAIDFARSTGAKSMSLETAIDNVEAQPLYEELGFKRDTQYYHYDLSL